MQRVGNRVTSGEGSVEGEGPKEGIKKKSHRLSMRLNRLQFV